MHHHTTTTPNDDSLPPTEPPYPYIPSSPSSAYSTTATRGSSPSVNGDGEVAWRPQQGHEDAAEDRDRALASASVPSEGQQGANGVVSPETQRALEEQERARQLVAAYQHGLIPYYYVSMGGGYGRYGPGWY